MDVRQKMRNFREEHSLTQAQMAKQCKISEALLYMIENADVTHPNIVKRIQKQYQLTDLEAEQLLPKNRRKHGGHYDPDQYKPIDFEYLRQPEKVKGNTYAD